MRKGPQRVFDIYNGMSTLKEENDKKILTVQIDDSLEKYKAIPLFQDKVDKANETLRTVGLPKLPNQ